MKGDQEIGVCVIEHHLFNPFDLGAPRTTFLGGEIHTVQEFHPDRAYRVEAKVRWNPNPPYVPYPGGLVNSVFLYGDGDEIDIEFVSKQINAGNTVTTNTWNEGCQKPQCPCLECPCAPCPWCLGCVERCSCQGNECTAPQGLDLTQWQTFRIYWYPNPRRIEWKWVTDPNTPDEVEVGLREETDAFYLPDEPMAVYLNFWAPDTGWECAYDGDLQPVQDLSQNEILAYEIDYVEVRTEVKQHSPPQCVDEIVSESCPCWCGHCTTCGACACPECCYSPAWRMVGAPDFHIYSPTGRSWSASPGEGGEVVVKFSRGLAGDGDGGDLRFWQGDGAGAGTSRVFVSLDCVSFVEFATLLSDGVHSGGDPDSDGYYFDFDLAEVGLKAARCVKVVDMPGDCDASGIDAIEALNLNTIPAASSWGLAVMTLVVLFAGTVLLIRRVAGDGESRCADVP